MDKRQTGVILVVVSAFVFSTAGIFTKGISVASWDIIFWRGVSAAGFTLGYLAARGRLTREIRDFGWPALVVTLMMGAGTAAFIPAFKLSYVANVAMIYGAAPFVAAILGWVFLREAPSRTVAIASTVAFGGVALIFANSFGGLVLRGDMFALFMTVMMAGTMVVYRAYPATTAALPAALSSIILLPMAYYFGDPFAAPVGDMPWLILFGLVFAVASVTLSEGARRLAPAETALLSILEMPLAPVLAYLILAEQPSAMVIIGGAVIVAAVLWSQASEQAKVD